jgi:magnesium-transporting ATPase (P-type)
MFFGKHSAWLLIPGGLIILLWALESRHRRDTKKEDWEKGVNVETWVKVFSAIGMIYGLFLMIGAVMMEIGGWSPSLAITVANGGKDTVNHFTTVIYFVTGMVMFFKPMKDVPFASLVALGVATFVTILAVTAIPDNFIGALVIKYAIPLKWLLVIVFLVVLALVYSLSKFAFSVMKTISKIVSLPPFALIYGCFVIIDAILLIAGVRIVAW